MKIMNQIPAHLRLRDFTNDDNPYGTHRGRESFQRLVDHIEDTLEKDRIVGLSFDGLLGADSSFLRESIISTVKRYRDEKSFFLMDLEDSDIRDNCDYVAKVKEQPLILWTLNGAQVLGPEPSPSNKVLLDLVLSKSQLTAVEAASELDITVPNASTRLKKLHDEGYIMRIEQAAESGGKEYIYKAIK